MLLHQLEVVLWRVISFRKCNIYFSELDIIDSTSLAYLIFLLYNTRIGQTIETWTRKGNVTLSG